MVCRAGRRRNGGSNRTVGSGIPDSPDRMLARLAVLQSGNRAGSQVDADAGDHHRPVLEQVLFTHHPTVGLARPEFHQQPEINSAFYCLIRWEETVQQRTGIFSR